MLLQLGGAIPRAHQPRLCDDTLDLMYGVQSSCLGLESRCIRYANEETRCGGTVVRQSGTAANAAATTTTTDDRLIHKHRGHHNHSISMPHTRSSASPIPSSQSIPVQSMSSVERASTPPAVASRTNTVPGTDRHLIDGCHCHPAHSATSNARVWARSVIHAVQPSHPSTSHRYPGTAPWTWSKPGTVHGLSPMSMCPVQR